MTNTPITDAEERIIYSEGNYGMGDEYAERVVDSDICRKLERDRAVLLETLQGIASCSEYEAHNIAKEAYRLLGKVVPSDQNSMIDWAVKSKDSVYTNAGAAYRVLGKALGSERRP